MAAARASGVTLVVASLSLLVPALAGCAFLFDTESLQGSGDDAGAATDAGASDATDGGGAPPEAAAAGYVNLVYSSDHGWDIGVDGNHGSHDWYTTPFFNGPVTPASSLQVDGGVLTLGCPSCAAAQIQTASPGANQHAFQHGYFEATLRFDPTRGPSSDGWISWWTLSLEHANGNDAIDASTGYERFAQFDVLQSATQPGGHAPFDGGAYTAAIHQFEGVFNVTCTGMAYCETKNADDVLPVPPGTDWNEFHRFGCLWVPGGITWYFDDHAETQVTWQPGQEFSVLDAMHLILVLGTGSSWPVEVQSVRVWQ